MPIIKQSRSERRKVARQVQRMAESYKYWQPLFDYLHEELGVISTVQEMAEIAAIVRRLGW